MVIGNTQKSTAQLTVGSHAKLSGSLEPLINQLTGMDEFGSSITNLGILNADFGSFLAVGAPGDDDGGLDRGAFYITVLNQDGTISPTFLKISDEQGEFGPSLRDRDRFGASLAALPDFAGTGVTWLAVGAPGDDDRGNNQGAVYLVQISSGAKVSGAEKNVGFSPGGQNDLPLDPNDLFGSSLADFGKTGDNGHLLAVGAPGDGDFENDTGAVWILQLAANTTISGFKKISATSGNFGGDLESGDQFGISVANIGDLNNDGIDDMAIGAPGDDDGGEDRGAVWIIFRNTTLDWVKISDFSTDFIGILDDRDRFGTSVAGAGDLDQDGIPDLLIGAPGDDDGGEDSGAVWALTLRSDGTVKAFNKLSNASPGFADVLSSPDRFGSAISNIGDINGDGRGDIAVGATGDADVAPDGGAAWLIYTAPRPQIEITSVSPTLPEVGQDVQISANISVFTGSAAPTISFRRAGEATFLTAFGTESSPGAFTFTLPFDQFFSIDFSDLTFFQPRGAEYFISVVDGAGGRAFFPSAGIISIPVSVPTGIELPRSQRSAANAYRLISVPLDLEDKSARTLFEDDLGSYSRKSWRFFDYLEDGSYMELDRGEINIIPGKSFWLLVKDQEQSINTGNGTTLLSSTPYKIGLLPGWNFVANPFNFDIPRSGLSRMSTQQLELRAYDGSGWITSEDSFSPFEGYLISNISSEPDTLIVSPGAIPLASKRSFSKDETVAGKFSDATSWSLTVSASLGLASDTDNHIVAAPDASAGWDTRDRPEPPVIGDYLSVYFPHEDWGRTIAHFDIDARPVSAAGDVWPIEIVSARGGAAVLEFGDLELVPIELEVWLRDEYSGVVTDLRDMPTVTVSVPPDGEPARLSIIIGTRSSVELLSGPEQEIPNTVEIFQNYPNPFRSSTTISFSLPESTVTHLEIYNILGQRVAILLDGALSQAGKSVVVWDGRSSGGIPVSSGVYFVRLTAGNNVKTDELLLLR